MGSPLGPTFGNFYMGHVENTILENSSITPRLYARYVDDIFLEVDSEEQLIKIKEAMENTSVLKFTYELSLNKKLPFLDVLLNNNSKLIETKVYRKKTGKKNVLILKASAHKNTRTVLLQTIFTEHIKYVTHGKNSIRKYNI